MTSIKNYACFIACTIFSSPHRMLSGPVINWSDAVLIQIVLNANSESHKFIFPLVYLVKFMWPLTNIRYDLQILGQ